MLSTCLPVPSEALSTPQLIIAAAARYGRHTFIEDGSKSISYSEFLQACREVAAGLSVRGVKPGETVAVWAPNRWEWIVAAMAIQYAGCILVTLNTRYKGGEAEQILVDSGAVNLFCVGDFLSQNYPSMLDRNKLPALREVFVIGEGSSLGDTTWEDLVTSGREWIDANGYQMIDERAAGVNPDDPADLLFTSGTTGAPKGVVACHRQNIRTFSIWAEILGLGETDRYLAINPFFHSFGLKAGILAALISGSTLLPQSIFEVETVLRRISGERVTVMPGPPTLFQSILAHPSRHLYNLSSLRKVTTGAATIPQSLIRRMREEIGIETVLTAYGLSECCGLATICHPGDGDEIIARTSGRAIPGVEVRCVDRDGSTLPPGQAGEVCVRGFNVMQGYLNDPDATAGAIDDDRWLHTGDVGMMDGEGNLTITDRLKDMFITGGFNCYPAEIENTLTSHPGIAMCAVIGVPDARLGEVAMAWVVPSPEAVISEATVIEWSRDRMANFKVPRFVQVVDTLPINASGKVIKTELRSVANNLI